MASPSGSAMLRRMGPSAVGAGAAVNHLVVNDEPATAATIRAAASGTLSPRRIGPGAAAGDGTEAGDAPGTAASARPDGSDSACPDSDSPSV